MSIEISEIKLELAKLLLQHLLQEKSKESQTPAAQNHIPPTKSTSTQITIEETDLKIKHPCETSLRKKSDSTID